MAIDETRTKDPRGKVVSQFKVFWNDASPKRVVVLQFPNRNRDQPYNEHNHLKPERIRLKPKAGMVELDVPLDTQAKGHFNKEKAVYFGQELSKSKLIGAGGSYGMAGGFGIGGVGSRRGRVHQDEDDSEPEGEDDAYAYNERKGKVFKTLTLAGKIQQFKAGDPIYAMATFKGDEIHLTRVDAICSLSPQYPHLDAIVDNEKTTRMRDADSGAPDSVARAVNVTIKQGDHDNSKKDLIGDTLKALQEEQFQSLKWVDEDDHQAYTTFQDHLFYRGNDSSQKLVSMMDSMTYLDSISAPKIDEKALGQKIAQQHKAAVADDWDTDTSVDTDVEVMQEEGQRRQMAVD